MLSTRAIAFAVAGFARDLDHRVGIFRCLAVRLQAHLVNPQDVVKSD